MPAPQLRNFCFTLNNYSPDDIAAVESLPFKYLIYGKEVGESGTPHLQGYCELAAKKTLSAIKKIIPRAHIESRRGTSQEAADYCKKDNDFVEHGVCSNPGKRNDLTAFVESVKAQLPTPESLAESSLYMRYPRHCDYVIDLYHKPTALSTLDNHWFYGPSGTGKSRQARELYPNAYIKSCNKWFDNYLGEETVIIDDIDDTHKFMGYFLKIWSDHYPFRAEYKGGSRMIRPKRIIVTSNFQPDEIWTENQFLEPILRRFQLKKFE